MKRILTLTLFLGIVWGQSELMGTWVRENKYNYISYKIYKSGGKQFIDYRQQPKEDNKYPLKIGKDFTKILYNPWFGESYYEGAEFYNEEKGRYDKIRVEIVLIDPSTILILEEKYYRE